jgi:hypothetical protein
MNRLFSNFFRAAVKRVYWISEYGGTSIFIYKILICEADCSSVLVRRVRMGGAVLPLSLPYSFVAHSVVAGQRCKKSFALPDDAVGSLVKVSFLSCLWAVVGCPSRCRLKLRLWCRSRTYDKRDTLHFRFRIRLCFGLGPIHFTGNNMVLFHRNTTAA